ncbi:MAG: SDR family oxidoreductase [Nitrosospira sp.]|nr:SDR family oxidoreductase [Nitrosospira sp.]
MNGKIVLITGATSGIGLESAVMIAQSGAKVIIVGRNPEKTEAVLAQIKQRSDSSQVESMLCDFASQADIHRLAKNFLSRHDRLDVLINNAGAVNDKRTLTEDGIETTFAVNHLGYFLLTHLLLDRIKASAPARIVNVASGAHYRGTLDFDDLGFERRYKIMHAYARSKLANVLFTRELARRLKGTGVTSNAVHPGVVATHIWDRAPGWTQPIFTIVKRIFMIAPEKGAQRIAWLAASPEVEGKTGLYFENNQPKEPSTLARDDALAGRLWRQSKHLVHLSARPTQRFDN